MPDWKELTINTASASRRMGSVDDLLHDVVVELLDLDEPQTVGAFNYEIKIYYTLEEITDA